MYCTFGQTVRIGSDIRDHLVKPPYFIFEKQRPKQEEKFPQHHIIVSDKKVITKGSSHPVQAGSTPPCCLLRKGVPIRLDAEA